MEPEPLTTDDVDAYLDHQAAQRVLGERTQKMYRSDLLDLVARCPTGSLDELLSWVATGITGRELAPSSRNRRRNIASGFFKWLVRTKDGWERNPVEHVVPSREERVYREPPSDHQLRAVMEAIPHSARYPWMAKRDAAMISLLFFVGLRVAELHALDLDQVDLQGCRLLRARRKGRVQADEYLSAPCRRALKGYLKVRPEADTRALMLSMHLQRASIRGIQKRVARLGELAGLQRRLHPHALRHSHATLMHRACGDIRVVSESLRHSKLETTVRYVAMDGDAVRAARDQLVDIGDPPDHER